MRTNLTKIAHILVILLIVGIGVQTITSCSSDDKDDGTPPAGGVTGGGDIGPCIDGTVTIGTQVWQKCNLNVDPGTGNSACYDNDPANCAKYGRLYSWATAMALPYICDSTADCPVSAKHQGICPRGWHIPSNADWDKLYRYVDGSSGTDSPYSSPTAGTKLKARSGWNDYCGEDDWDCEGGGTRLSGNGTDDYGFAALPGGSGVDFDDNLVTLSTWTFNGAGNYGRWQSSAGVAFFGAVQRGMSNNNEIAKWSISSNRYLFSVRCLKD